MFLWKLNKMVGLNVWDTDHESSNFQHVHCSPPSLLPTVDPIPNEARAGWPIGRYCEGEEEETEAASVGGFSRSPRLHRRAYLAGGKTLATESPLVALCVHMSMAQLTCTCTLSCPVRPHDQQGCYRQGRPVAGLLCVPPRGLPASAAGVCVHVSIVVRRDVPVTLARVVCAGVRGSGACGRLPS